MDIPMDIPMDIIPMDIPMDILMDIPMDIPMGNPTDCPITLARLGPTGQGGMPCPCHGMPWHAMSCHDMADSFDRSNGDTTHANAHQHQLEEAFTNSAHREGMSSSLPVATVPPQRVPKFIRSNMAPDVANRAG